MRIVFLGTGEIALPTLRWLLSSDRHEVVGVVTQPDRPVGRRQVLTPPEIKVLAQEAGVPVAQPERIRRDLSFLEDWNADLFAVMAYGQILPKALLELPPIACLNLHASLLPRHRGASPIQAAIREGDPTSGITVMHIAEGLDTGDIVLKHEFELAPDETGGSLHDRLADIAPAALAEALTLLQSGEATRTSQEESLATYAGKLTREDGELDWSLPAPVIERTIRAHDPWPGSTTRLHAPGEEKPRRLKIFPVELPSEHEEGSGDPGTILRVDESAFLVATGEGGILRISEIQPEGSRRMFVADYLRGRPFVAGSWLG